MRLKFLSPISPAVLSLSVVGNTLSQAPMSFDCVSITLAVEEDR